MILVYVHVTIDLYSNLNIIILMADEDLKLETKCYDANEYGYLYGLNRRIPDEEFEKVKSYFREFRRMDFKEGNIQVTGRPEGWRCLEKDVSKVEEILGITNTLESRQNKVKDRHKARTGPFKTGSAFN